MVLGFSYFGIPLHWKEDFVFGKWLLVISKLLVIVNLNEGE